MDAAGWQVRQGDDALGVHVAGPGRGVDPVRLEQDVTTALQHAGAASPPVRVRTVDAIPAGAAGKRPLVVAQHPHAADAAN